MRKILETIDIHAEFEIKETKDEVILLDDFLVHNNNEHDDLPVKIYKKELMK